MNAHNERKILLLFTVILLILIPISLCIGRYTIDIRTIFTIITGGDAPKLAKDVFFSLRLPRVIMAVLAGAGLSLSGHVYQTLFKNPLASPDIIGIASGANAGAAVGIVLIGSGTYFVSGCAFLGGIIAALAAVFLANLSRRRTLASIVLAGIVISSVAQAVIMTLKLFADPESQLAPLEFWSMGGLSAITDTKLLSVLPGFLIGLIVLIMLRYKIVLLSLSDEEAKTLGVNVELVRTVVMLASTVMVSSVVSATGLITFIGLIGPHAARLLTKRNDSLTAVLSAVLGALLIIVADCFARSLGSSEIPISILTSLMGAPFLVWLMIKRRSSQLY